jgi:hypothetical protein
MATEDGGRLVRGITAALIFNQEYKSGSERLGHPRLRCVESRPVSAGACVGEYTRGNAFVWVVGRTWLDLKFGWYGGRVENVWVAT